MSFVFFFSDKIWTLFSQSYKELLKAAKMIHGARKQPDAWTRLQERERESETFWHVGLAQYSIQPFLFFDQPSWRLEFSVSTPDLSGITMQIFNPCMPCHEVIQNNGWNWRTSNCQYQKTYTGWVKLTYNSAHCTEWGINPLLLWMLYDAQSLAAHKYDAVPRHTGCSMTH